ncbi:MAG TPA: shikimate kinase [Verrucomicrobiae bacterium]|nr:shikimate kinase [Verrucomicrobiae bacterium]
MSQRPPACQRVFLCGLPGSGKSTVALQLAALLGWSAVDLDQAIEVELGRPVAEIFAELGAGAFRAREREALGAVCERHEVVVSLGGGSLDHPHNLARVRAAGMVLWLDAPDSVLAARCGRDPGRRPLLAGDPEQAIVRLRAHRQPILEEAGPRIETGDIAPAAVAARCLEQLAPGLGGAARGEQR